jgi:PPOX class probable F420-dependent enzyme
MNAGETLTLSGWLDAFVAEQRVARLATVDARGRPALVPIVYAYDGARLFTPVDDKPKRVAARELQRVRNILANPHVTVLFDQYDEDWDALAWVRLRGTAELVTEGELFTQGVDLLCTKYPQYERRERTIELLIVITPDDVQSWRATPAG